MNDDTEIDIAINTSCQISLLVSQRFILLWVKFLNVERKEEFEMIAKKRCLYRESISTFTGNQLE